MRGCSSVITPRCSPLSYRIDSCGASHSARLMRTAKRPNVLLPPYPIRHYPFYRLTKYRQLPSSSFSQVITTSFLLLIRIPININSLSNSPEVSNNALCIHEDEMTGCMIRPRQDDRCSSIHTLRCKKNAKW